LIPVTIRQLHGAIQSAPEDVFKIDGRELNQITMVAKIHSLSTLATNTNLVVEDGTGSIEVRVWLEPEEQPPWTLGSYVRIFGSLRSFNNKRNVVGFKVYSITDFNEITHHLLETIYIHLYHTKGQAAPRGGGNQPSTFANPFQNTVQPHQPQMYGTDSLKEAVMAVISASQSSQGIDIRSICSAVNRSEAEVRNTVEFLSSEGHVYSTIDDDHYATTNRDNM